MSELHSKLVATLMNIPGIRKPSVRDALLLVGIPRSEDLDRDKENANNDLIRIVEQLDKLYLSKIKKSDTKKSFAKKWCLSIFINNAVDRVADFSLEEELKEIQEELLQEKWVQLQLSLLAEKQPDETNLSQPAQSGEDSRLDELLDPSNFDLTILVRDFMNKILRKQGLIGFAVPYDDHRFLVNFSKRVRVRLGSVHIDIPGEDAVWNLKPYIMSGDDAITIFKSYRNLLKTGHVVCPVLLPEDSSISNNFWQDLHNEFTGRFKYCLVILMAGSPDYKFPEGLIKLEIQHPEIADVHDWVRRIVQHLGWPSKVTDIWREEMESQCCREGNLSIELIYRHIGISSGLLRSKPVPTPDQFLAKLKNRRRQLGKGV